VYLLQSFDEWHDDIIRLLLLWKKLLAEKIYAVRYVSSEFFPDCKVVACHHFMVELLCTNHSVITIFLFACPLLVTVLFVCLVIIVTVLFFTILCESMVLHTLSS
jgi:hypothetical protein